MNSNEGLISIIIPVYNVEDFLDECIRSALNQTYQWIEVLLIDDGSTDSCPLKCDQYELVDSRVKVTHQSNRGLSGARNAGLLLARGEYVYFLDSDDFISLDTIEKLHNVAKEKDLDVVLFDADVVDESGQKRNGDRLYIRSGKYDSVYEGERLFTEMKRNDEYRSAVPLLFIRKSFLDEVNLSFHEGILHEDELFTFVLLMKCRRAGHLPESLYHRRIRSGSIMTTSGNENQFRGLQTVLEEMVSFYLENENLHKNQEVKNHLVHIFNITLKRYKELSVEHRVRNKCRLKELKELMRKVNYLENWKVYIKCRYELISNVFECLTKSLRAR